MKKEITTQKQLDDIADDFKGGIHIIGEIDRLNRNFPNANVYVYGNAQISNVDGNAQISNVYGNAQIRYVDGNAQISNVYGNAQIRYVYGNAQISNVYGNAQIRYVDGNAQISNVNGNAAVLFIKGDAKVETMGFNIVSKFKGSNAELTTGKNTTIVMLDEFHATWDYYAKFYPVKVNRKKATMYKAVHKKNGKFFSDHDRNFEYVIGKKYEHECAPKSKGSCATGLHIAHLAWALRFGCGWSDVAILECEVPTDCIVVADDCDGKVRTSELTVIRELDKTEL